MTAMECILCNVSDDSVVNVASCTNRCTVTAHPTCFQKRHTSTMWRKKHHTRGNDEHELCLVYSCQGKCKVKSASQAKHSARGPRVKDLQQPAVSQESALDDPTRPCCFMGNDGLPCRRAAVKNSACARHMKQADLMCKMVEAQETPRVETDTIPVDEETTKKKTKSVAIEPKKKSSRSVSSQTEEIEQDAEMRRELEEMEYAAQREALRVTRMEIHWEQAMERLNAERESLHAATRSDKDEIARLTEEVERLRTENVTIKRREEATKAKCLTAMRDAEGARKNLLLKLERLIAEA